MSNLIACQPGWVAVFHQIDGDGFTVEPVACWMSTTVNTRTEVHPVCALGGDVCDATQADNYVGVIGPGQHQAQQAKQLVAAYHESIKNRPTAA